MLKTIKPLLAFGLLSLSAISADATAAERPTFQVTCDPRPDILPYHLYYSHTEYRRVYNRPRYHAGWIAHKISATSQEAMVWCENLQAGNYDEKHMPPMYKRYFAPKPWEVLQTGPRPDFPKPKAELLRQPTASSSRRQTTDDANGSVDANSPATESSPIDLGE